MKALTTKTIWIIAGCLFIVAGLTASGSPLTGPTRAVLVWTPVYAVAVAILLLAWGGPTRRSILQSNAGWVAVVVFLAVPFIGRTLQAQFVAAQGMGRPSGDTFTGALAVGITATAITCIAGFVLVRHTIRSGLVPTSLHTVIYVILGVWILASFVLYLPITDMEVLPIVIEIVTIIRMLVPAAFGVVLLLAAQKVTTPADDPVVFSSRRDAVEK